MSTKLNQIINYVANHGTWVFLLLVLCCIIFNWQWLGIILCLIIVLSVLYSEVKGIEGGK